VDTRNAQTFKATISMSVVDDVSGTGFMATHSSLENATLKLY